MGQLRMFFCQGYRGENHTGLGNVVIPVPVILK